MLEQFYEKDKIEVGIDEAGRGCLFGPVTVGAVVWLPPDPLHNDMPCQSPPEIKDSKNLCPFNYKCYCNNYPKLCLNLIQYV